MATVLPVAVVPDPGVPVRFGPEVGLAVVVDLRGEAQQAAVGGGGRLAGGGGQAGLLQGALQHEHGPVLHVGGLLHHLRVQHQVRGRWGREEDKEKLVRRSGAAGASPRPHSLSRTRPRRSGPPLWDS